jgi:DNA invertase Pin-like site-specific DNA recombinase
LVEWVQETVTGSKHWKKRKLGDLVDKLNKGDIFITSEISRVGRNGLEISEFISVCIQKGITIYMTKTDFTIDGSITSQALINAYTMSAQIERELNIARTKNALKTCREKGIKLGRPKGKLKLKLEEKLPEIKKLIADGVKFKSIANKYSVSQNTITNLVKRYELKISKSNIVGS